VRILLDAFRDFTRKPGMQELMKGACDADRKLTRRREELGCGHCQQLVWTTNGWSPKWYAGAAYERRWNKKGTVTERT